MTHPKDIGWVEPATPIRGLDHLGVQAPCIALYAQLLPGITNVTDRARYYSFHPWLIRSFEQRYQNHSIEEFRRVLRRAECLFALIAIRHARVEADGDDARHGIGMVTHVTKSPDAAATPQRRARQGDLVVLGQAMDPRVRVVLRVAPSGVSDKLAVLDLEDHDGEKQFMTSHVKYVAWAERIEPSRRVAGV